MRGVSIVDREGNEIAGIKSLVLTVPIGGKRYAVVEQITGIHEQWGAVIETRKYPVIETKKDDTGGQTIRVGKAVGCAG